MPSTPFHRAIVIIVAFLAIAGLALLSNWYTPSTVVGQTVGATPYFNYLPAVRLQPTPTPTYTPTPTSSPTPIPSATPTSSPTPTFSPTPTLTPVPTNTPLPSGVFVMPNTYTSEMYETQFTLWGEVYNNTSRIVEDIEINVSIYDASGAFIGSGSDTIWNRVVGPGDKTCFEIDEDDMPAGWASYTIDSVTYDDFGGTLHSVIALLSHRGYATRWGGYEITGQMQNTSDSQLKFVKAIGTLYSSDEKVIGCDYDYLDNSDLPPGGVSAFEIRYYGVPTTVSSYRLQAAGSFASSTHQTERVENDDLRREIR